MNQKHSNAKPPLPPPAAPPHLYIPSQPAFHDHPPMPPQQTAQIRSPMDDSPRSSLRSDSPLHSDEPEKPSTGVGGGAVVAVEKYYSPLQSPVPITPPKDASIPDNFHHSSANSNDDNNIRNSHVINFNRAIREEMASSAMVLGGGGGGGGGGGRLENEGSREREKKRGGWFSGRRWKRDTDGEDEYDEEREGDKRVVEQIVNRSRTEVVLLRAALGLRVFELVLSLISFSVMASDKTDGWSGDSFDRYKEYRFCLTVNVLAFVYSAFQVYVLSSHLMTGKHVISHHLRYQFDFFMDQILAYLLISASSAAASKVDDWVTNWGKDEFTEKASASVSMSFLAFVCFAFSSLISGFNLCNRDFS